MKVFDQPIPQEKLDILSKTRSNPFTWRGQFSPQLIEVILNAYCLPNSMILDPFAGSGTVLLESTRFHGQAYGFDVNPAAYILSKIYELINLENRTNLIKRIRYIIDREFTFRIFEHHEIENLESKLTEIRSELDPEILKIFDALVILLDVANHKVTHELIQSKFNYLVDVIEKLPYSDRPINVGLSDARSLPIPDKSIDFVITSPPYINVFNYHQNYRKSTELLGWDLLKIAKSEIGSNRANRRNRFYTVVQYCLDMADTLREISRVTQSQARIVFIVGHQSNVLGIPFYNADIIEKIAVRSKLFHKCLRQKREFKNKFGKLIREDIINFYNLNSNLSQPTLEEIAREVADEILNRNLPLVSCQNKKLLEQAIDQVHQISRTPTLDPQQLCVLPRSKELRLNHSRSIYA
ncbi:DNA methyltransferase [Roseofilum sp. BLCC_M154]|uniref:site-specific DNA-methyltransferase (cytosine-N(4)-specific) n=1 Tax=Roseofilum acuticapitatum BLCC-M154 TaxID=3022444 RepID=A0ABT7AV52_9CYAN|nr:DNA methyltransferase [Roseofilum acuticapitatum]MDJ1170770.1 DNA methyltransferase [Roseofilum acuticapitatum BLCC-M154]